MPTLSTRTPTAVMLITGEYFDHTAPDPAVITLDVLQAGMRAIRFNGQTIRVINLAEHSIRVRGVSMWIGNADGLGLDAQALLGVHALLHDAHETILPWGDCLRPGKTAEMREVEARTDRVIWQALELEPPTEQMARIIKAADEIALYCEATWWQPGSSDWVAWPDLPEHWPAREWLIETARHPTYASAQVWREQVDATMARLAEVRRNAATDARVDGA